MSVTVNGPACTVNGNHHGVGGGGGATVGVGAGGSSGVDSGGGISPVGDVEGGSSSSGGASYNNRKTSNASAADGSNAFYGLHALNNLDIAVNGKDVNAMPSYQEVRRNVRSNANNNLDSSGGSAEYSPPQPRDGCYSVMS